jgi:transcriptional regulator with XRE-family HTH domain
MTPSEFILGLAKEKNISLRQMGEILGINSASLYLIKGGRAKISPRIANAINEKYGIDLAIIVNTGAGFVPIKPKNLKKEKTKEEDRTAHLPRDIKKLSKYCDNLLDGKDAKAIRLKEIEEENAQPKKEKRDYVASIKLYLNDQKTMLFDRLGENKRSQEDLKADIKIDQAKLVLINDCLRRLP